ncbi:MAG: MBL fold metallo-hydrolase [Pseudomonadota bacterium]
MPQPKSVYLRPNVIIEPLVDRWYAWPHLISPATAARNITERHLKIMASYVEAPHFHAAAARNPSMKGGPFMDYGSDRSTEVRALIDVTNRVRAPSIALSHALADLDRLLADRARGGPLAPLYADMPEVLKGFVELHYDRSNHPGFRLVEPLLYRAFGDGPASQSLYLSLGSGIRPFMMSTPRLAEPNEALLPLPFDHVGVDVLFELFRSPRPLEELGEIAGLGASLLARLSPFVTEQPPARAPAAPGRGSRWRYFGHACVLLEAPGCAILLDPAIKTADDDGEGGFDDTHLPDRIDYVLLTHNHQDHVLLETLLRLRHRIGAIVVPRSGSGALEDPSLRLVLVSLGFRNVMELDEFESIEAEGVSITAAPFLGEHGDLAIRSKAIWHIRISERRLLFAADCKNLSPALFRKVRDAIGTVDTLFLGMECDGAPMSWIYGPLFASPPQREHDQTRRLAGCDFEEAVELVEIFAPGHVYVYAMGMEAWLNYIMATRYTPESNPIVASQKLVDACRDRGLQAERLYGAREVAL